MTSLSGWWCCRVQLDVCVYVDDAKRRQTKVWAEGKGCNQFELILSLGNLTLQWTIHYVQVYFLFGTCDFHCCVRLLEVLWKLNLISRLLCMATPQLPRRIFLACNRKALIPQLCLKVKEVVDYSTLLVGECWNDSTWHHPKDNYWDKEILLESLDVSLVNIS